MTAKEFVRARCPKAKSESHRENGPYGKKYWLIRNGNEYFYMASSEKSESNAWVNAKKRLKTQELNNK